MVTLASIPLGDDSGALPDEELEGRPKRSPRPRSLCRSTMPVSRESRWPSARMQQRVEPVDEGWSDVCRRWRRSRLSRRAKGVK